jgi:hypothetical protein
MPDRHIVKAQSNDRLVQPPFLKDEESHAVENEFRRHQLFPDLSDRVDGRILLFLGPAGSVAFLANSLR